MKKVEWGGRSDAPGAGEVKEVWKTRRRETYRIGSDIQRPERHKPVPEWVQNVSRDYGSIRVGQRFGYSTQAPSLTPKPRAWVDHGPTELNVHSLILPLIFVVLEVIKMLLRNVPHPASRFDRSNRNLLWRSTGLVSCFSPERSWLIVSLRTSGSEK